ncbi:GNAT family N-acetyltransferase [Hyphomicrobium sp. B1]|uniref:GNAT family N-acetyltransferase n=1 Tax=Hyphomicrobium sp. B1 TaxID=3075651 RepID=UPI003C2EFD28
MATAETGNGVYLSAGGEQARSATPGESRFVAEIFDGADDALAALEVIEGGLVATGFQTLNWLTVFYDEVAHAHRAMPRLAVVTDSESDQVVLALPLVVAKEGLLRVASLAALEAVGQGAPLLGPEPLSDPDRIRDIWRALRAAIRDVDLIRLERMPAEIGGCPNPLIDLFGSSTSRASAHRLVITGSFDDYLQGLGKRYRKDVERCHRLWQSEDNPRLVCAETDDEIAHVFATMEEQQAVWHAARGTKDIFAERSNREFFERLAFDGADAGVTSLFALEAGGRIVATLFGLTHEGAFSLLSISTGGEQWSHLSPGRLVVLEMVKHLVAQGIRRFDFGINANPLKHGFGTEEVPLYDLVVAQDLAAVPKALVHELAVQLRGTSRLTSALKRALPRFRS